MAAAKWSIRGTAGIEIWTKMVNQTLNIAWASLLALDLHDFAHRLAKCPEQWQRARKEQGVGDEHGEGLAVVQDEGVRAGEHVEAGSGAM